MDRREFVSDRIKPESQLRRRDFWRILKVKALLYLGYLFVAAVVAGLIYLVYKTFLHILYWRW